MRVAIDARGVHSRLQGVGRNVLNLLLGLSHKESDLEFIVIYNDPLARKLVERSGGPYRGRFQWVKSMAGVGHLMERVEIPWLLKIHKASLFHDIGCSGVWTANIPIVTTVHELAPERDTEKMRRALRDSTLIVAVSYSVADEIESRLNMSRPKIRIISNAVDPFYTERVPENEVRAMRERFKLPAKYFLCVTADRPSKNPEIVKRIAAQWAGPEQWVFTMKGTDNQKCRYLDIVEDAWLRPLYSASTALIAPSHYEGFSLPPIEALSSGTVPIVSDIPPHREALGDVLLEELFFNPTSDTALERALWAVLNGSDVMRTAVVERFRNVNHRYSVVETAIQMQAVYREVLKG